MTEATVIRSPRFSKSSKTAPVSRTMSARVRRAAQRQRYAAYFIGAVALTLTGLSLSHLAEGVQALTQSSHMNSWAMAAGIDLGFIGLELGQLAITSDKLRTLVGRYANPAICGTLIASAAMNAFAFGSKATDCTHLVSACALGIAVPALIYVLSRVSAAMWMDAQKG